ncbi:MAG TPA: GNAT family N-acetyltransferase [Vicinamibacterales bacterium]
MTTGTWTIRPARADDREALGRLGAMLMRVHHDFDPHRFLAPGAHAEEGYAAFLTSQLDDPDVLVLVAADGDRVLGYVYAGVEPMSWRELRDRAGFIHDLAVDTPARRQGVATALLGAAIDWLRSRGMPRVMLWTAHGNDAAQALFAREGFRRTMVEMTREL